MVKDKTVKEHRHDTVHYVKCWENQCSEDYTGEITQRLTKRTLGHYARDSKSHLVEDTIEESPKYPKIDNLKTTGKSCKSHNFKQKLTGLTDEDTI